nr:MAG TPA: hypothetical protein [Caudoviricetes sp.]
MQWTISSEAGGNLSPERSTTRPREGRTLQVNNGSGSGVA